MKRNERWINPGLLVSGIILLALGQVRWGVDLLAWFAPVPFIIYLHRTSGWRSRLLLFAAFSLAWSLAAAKYITDPFPKTLILLYGLSFAVVSFAGYIIWDRLRQQVSPWIGNLCFAAVLVSIEWAQYMFTPVASNGAPAYTQLENLPFLQLASLFGISGISFVMYWFAAIVADAIAKKRVPWRQGAVVLGIIVAAHVFGAFRIGSPATEQTVRVATVGTHFDWFGGDVPSRDARLRVNNQLFEYTMAAATAGARLVVWNEVATIILADEENEFLSRAADAAREGNIHLVVSYLKTITLSPFLVENKYVWFGPKGAIRDTYLKHKTVPVEPSVPGDGIARIIDTGFGRATGAICYDFDFPQVGLLRARDAADLVVVPSSDMLGVDPFHTQIAAVRAIEGGYSVLRSTRMGLSAGIDQVGRFRSWLSSNETDARVMLAELPIGRRWTLYSVIGDVVAYLSILFVCFVIGLHIRNRKRASA